MSLLALHAALSALQLRFLLWKSSQTGRNC
jgi:hypothetical protein